VSAYRDRVQARSGPLFVAWIFGATIFFSVVSIVFIRNQVRPIERLAAAMERFGRGDESEGVFRRPSPSSKCARASAASSISARNCWRA